MSKVSDDIKIYFPGVKKEKFRHNLRRKETALKKKERMSFAKNNIYGYGRGYWIKDPKIWERVKKTYPAHIETKKELIEYRTVINRQDSYEEDENGDLKVRYKRIGIYDKKEEYIPEETITIGYTLKENEREPYLRRINISKRSLKKITNRKVRHNNNIGNGSNYKRNYDIALEIW